MDAPVCNKLFQRYARNFTAYRIKAGKCDGFGRVVNDEVNARDCFKRTDITALAADNAAFHLIVRQRNNGNSRFRRMVGCTALNGSGNNFPCERIRLIFGFLFEFHDFDGLLMGEIVLQVFEQIFFCLLLSKPGDPLKHFKLASFDALYFIQTRLSIFQFFVERFILFFEIFNLAVERLLLLDDPAFLALNF